MSVPAYAPRADCAGDLAGPGPVHRYHSRVTPRDRAPNPAVSRTGSSRRAIRAGVVTWLAYAFIGWRSMLVPSLIRSVMPAFAQDDAGMGTYFLCTALGYGTGSLIGGTVVRRLGVRVTLSGAAVVLGVCLVIQGLATTWAVFLAMGVVAGMAGAASDVSIGTLYLDLFPHARGRAINLLHVGWSLASLAAPLLLAFAVGAGVPWNALLVGTGCAWLLLSVALVVTVPADGRHHAPDATRGASPEADPAPGPGVRGRGLPVVLLAMAIAIGCYVGAEAAVSDWLVRVLHAWPLEVASTALALFWLGIALGRGVFAKIGNRVDPIRWASGMVAMAAVTLTAALLVPVPMPSLVLFGVTGFLFGPVFPLVFVAAGSLIQGRTATISMVLTFSAVVGAVAYPPSVGFLATAIGLQGALLGSAVLAFGAAAALVVARRLSAA